jgi:hypothetical protein
MASKDVPQTRITRLVDTSSGTSSERRVSVSLDSWTSHDWSNGIQINTCLPLEPIFVRTRNSAYEVIVMCGDTGDVLIRGGGLLPQFQRARLTGGTAGGSVLKMLGIYVGLRMELHVDGRRIVTSSVQAISRQPQRCGADAPC